MPKSIEEILCIGGNIAKMIPLSLKHMSPKDKNALICIHNKLNCLLLDLFTKNTTISLETLCSKDIKRILFIQNALIILKWRAFTNQINMNIPHAKEEFKKIEKIMIKYRVSFWGVDRKIYQKKL